MKSTHSQHTAARASVGKPESENGKRSLPPKMGLMFPSVLCVDRGKWGPERDIAKNVLVSIALYTLISHTKMSIYFRKGWSSNYILESQPAKLMLEMFS